MTGGEPGSVAAVWRRAEAAGALAAECVAVWRCFVTEATVARSVALLTAEDRARMERLRVERARQEFAVGRALARMVVGGALGIAAQNVAWSVGEFGKPVTEGVAFNVAHTRGVALVAVCRERTVGVDVEAIDTRVEMAEIAQRNFHPVEWEKVLGCEGAAQADAFFRLWARKEAVVKAHGQGLTLGTASFDASGAQVEAGGEMFVVEDLLVGDAVRAAVAVSGERMPRMELWEWV